MPENIKDEVYVINLDKYADIGDYKIVLYILNNEATYFDSCWFEHVPKAIKIFTWNKNIKKHIQNKSNVWIFFALDLLILYLKEKL